MTLSERIYRHSLNLPEHAAQEVLDFIEFLEQRYGANPPGSSQADTEAWFTGVWGACPDFPDRPEQGQLRDIEPL